MELQMQSTVWNMFGLGRLIVIPQYRHWSKTFILHATAQVRIYL